MKRVYSGLDCLEIQKRLLHANKNRESTMTDEQLDEIADITNYSPVA